MKNKIYILIAVLIINFVCSTVYAIDNKNNLKNSMNLVAENSNLKLYINKNTTELAVEEKNSNKVWYTNVIDTAKEKISRGESKERLKAQLLINYYLPTGQERMMDNYNNSVKLDQFKIKEIKNGVRINYTIGKKYSDNKFLPKIISEKRLEEQILSKIKSDSDKKLIEDNLYKIFLKKSDEFRRIELQNLNLNKLFGEYKFVSQNIIEEMNEIKKLEEKLKTADAEKKDDIERQIELKKLDMYSARRNMLNDFLNLYVNSRENIDTIEDLSEIDFAFLKKEHRYMLYQLAGYKENKFIELVKESGYTIEDVNYDRRQSNLGLVKKNLTVFKVPLEYYLDGNNLIVKIPCNQVEYPIDVKRDGEKVTLPLHSIELLPSFGAAHKDKQGYMFVPDGSGGLINFNKNTFKTVERPYKKRVFGENLSLANVNEKINYKKQVNLPVFGIKEGGKALFGIIEDGQSLADIISDKSGRIYSFNRIYSKFTIIPQGKMYLRTGNKEINTYQSRSYQGDIKIRFSFLTAKSANYVGMAKYYQNYLKEKYNWKKIKDKREVPLFLETIGAITELKPFLGIPQEVITSLTTFNQAETIIKKLQKFNVGNINLIYSGWLKKGVEHIYPSQVAVEKALGSSKDLLNLKKILNGKGNLYPEVGFLLVNRNSLFDDFQVYKDAARRINKEITEVYDYNLATYQEENTLGYILSPSKALGLVKSFLKDYKKYNLDGVSLSYSGKMVNSDFREKKKLIDREQALKIQIKFLEKIKQMEKKIISRGGNSYILPYARGIINLPLQCTPYKIIDEEVPFYQIVIHSFFPYAGNPLNFAPDYNRALLKMIESGALPYFKLFYADNSKVKDTNYNNLLSANYKIWLDKVKELYNNLGEDYADLQSQRIMDHNQLMEDVYKTTYENGVSVIVNYRKNEVKVEGVAISAEDFIFLKE